MKFVRFSSIQFFIISLVFVLINHNFAEAQWCIDDDPPVDASEEAGKFTSLALDSSNNPHISYYDGIGPDAGLKYAYHDGLRWHVERVAISAGQYTSLAFDNSNNPHISYYDQYSQDLKYAYHDEAGWHIETVDSEGSVGQYASLALDSSNNCHISYYDQTNQDLKHAYHDEAGWHIETVDSEGDVGTDTSLALDDSNNPHISYCYGSVSNFNLRLKYAYHDEAGWHTEVVDSQGVVGWNTSIVLDSSNTPHISYFDWINQDLKYAHYDGSPWHRETVDGEGSVGRYTSLALDSSNNPHISYYDYTNGHLKYAFKGDLDCDRIPDDGDNSGMPGDNPCPRGVYVNCDDNCPTTPNGQAERACYSWSGSVTACTSDADCGGSPDSCSKVQDDMYPPQGNGMGDACDCEGNFNCSVDKDVDGSDASNFKTDFGRSIILEPCNANDPCNGNFNCDLDVDGTDASIFKSDFGRSSIVNTCPLCSGGEWCVY